MADKPRLKESDEILNSIGKRRGKKQEAPILPSDILPPPITQVERGGDGSAGGGGGRRGRPRKEPVAGAPGPARPPEPRQPAPPPAETPPERDSRPLDFGKYELPDLAQSKKRRGRPRKEAVSEATVPPPARAEAAPPPPERRAEPEAEAERPRILHGEQAEVSQVREFSFEDLELQRKREERAKAMAAAEEARRAAEEARKAAEAAAERARREEEAAEELARKQAEIEAELERRAAEEEAERRRVEEESRRKLAEDRSYQDDVISKLGDQFEQQFSKRFEDGDHEASRQRWEEKPWWLEERREGLGKPIRPKPEPVPDPEEPTAEQKREEVLRRANASTAGRAAATVPEPPAPPSPAPQRATPPPEPPVEPSQELEALREAEQFLQLFEEEVRSEEEVREENFRETLAEKFMRERERYLRDLGIADQMEAERAAQESAEAAEEPMLPAAEPPRRRLDFQIQPEMHMPGDVFGSQWQDAPPAPVRPVTYTRGAQVQAQTPVPPGETQANAAPPLLDADGKKTPEQLLLELGAQSRQREERKAASEKKPTQFNFRFLPVKEPGEAGEEKPAKKRSPRSRTMARVVVLSACAGLLVLSLLAFGISRALNPLANIQPPGETSPAAESEEVFTAYENFNPDTVRKFQDFIVKRSGLTVSNLSVQGRLVVEEGAAGEGTLTLSNVMVGDYIYVNQSGVQVLELKDVTAKRIVIKNADQKVTVRASGSTDVETLELHTPSSVEKGELLDEAAGIRAVQVKNAAAGGALGVDVKESAIETLNTEGETVLTLTDARIETMTADGNLNLSGSGRVASLAAGLNSGGGAANPLPAYPVTILIKGVEVGHLNIKSQANVTLSCQVDSMAAADSMNLGGNGTVGSLVLNEKFGNARLSVDISGLNVQQLTTNAEALVNAAGSAIINTLTANAPTYALGNKVNLLVANADGVIFENEPDGKRIAQGVNPPQSRADNPNLDYSISGLVGNPSTDTTDDVVATTCDHAREVGGFVQGNGSLDNPYIVENALQLAHVGQHAESYFLQRGDVDIAAESSFADGFPMIGSGGQRFSGVYDGGGYAIRNLRILSEADSVGLFAENTGTIRNLYLVSGTVETTGNAFVGGLVGMNYQGGTVEACSNGALIEAEAGTYVGGIVGYNYGGRVRDCYNTARITGGDAAGGLVGMNMQGASLTGSYNIGVVAGNKAGAVVGVNEAVVTNCYYLDGDDIDGLGSGEGNVIVRTAEQLGSAQMAADLAAGNDQSLWQSSGSGAYDYPSLRAPSP